MRTLSKCMLALFVVCFLVRAQAPESKPIDPAKAAAIEEMLALNHADQTIKTVLDQYKGILQSKLDEAFARTGVTESSPLRADIEKFEERVFDLLADRLRWDRLKPEFVAIYDQTFTLEEVQGINAFYKSPVGQALLAKQPVLITRSIQTAQQLMVDTGPEIQKMTREFMEEMKKKDSSGQ